MPTLEPPTDGVNTPPKSDQMAETECAAEHRGSGARCHVDADDHGPMHQAWAHFPGQLAVWPVEPQAEQEAIGRVREFLRIVPIGRSYVGEGVVVDVSGLGSLTVADLRVIVDRAPTVDAAHIEHQREWSTATFGPAEQRGPLGPLAHIRKELVEVEEDPTVLEEWVDVIILAFDGAWRAGHEPQQIIDAVKAKQVKNEARSWPDWRGVPADQAIEHTSCGYHAWGADDRCVTCGDHRTESRHA